MALPASRPRLCGTGARDRHGGFRRGARFRRLRHPVANDHATRGPFRGLSRVSAYDWFGSLVSSPRLRDRGTGRLGHGVRGRHLRLRERLHRPRRRRPGIGALGVTATCGRTHEARPNGFTCSWPTHDGALMTIFHFGRGLHHHGPFHLLVLSALVVLVVVAVIALTHASRRPPSPAADVTWNPPLRAWPPAAPVDPALRRSYTWAMPVASSASSSTKNAPPDWATPPRPERRRKHPMVRLRPVLEAHCRQRVQRRHDEMAPFAYRPARRRWPL